MGDWDPQYIQPNPLAIAQPDAWAPLGQQPKDAGFADAWDVNGPAMAQPAQSDGWEPVAQEPK
jgi:hypothetical protein